MSGSDMNSEAFWLALETLVRQSKLVIDRPRGAKHPEYGFIYPLDYGYLSGTLSMDGNAIDVWHGTAADGTIDAVICTVDLVKKDSEIKILIGCTEQEKEIALRFCNDSECMKGVILRRR